MEVSEELLSSVKEQMGINDAVKVRDDSIILLIKSVFDEMETIGITEERMQSSRGSQAVALYVSAHLPLTEDSGDIENVELCEKRYHSLIKDLQYDSEADELRKGKTYGN